MIYALCRSFCALFSRWYLLLVISIVRRSTHTAKKSIDVKYGPFSVSIIVCTPKLYFQWSKSMFGIVVAAVWVAVIDFVSFEWSYVIAAPNWLSDFMFGNRSNMSMAIYSIHSESGTREAIVPCCYHGVVGYRNNYFYLSIGAICNTRPIEFLGPRVVSTTFSELFLLQRVEQEM